MRGGKKTQKNYTKQIMTQITMPSLPKVYPGKHLRFNRGALENEGEEVEKKTPHLSPLLPIHCKQSPFHSSGCSP